MVREVLVALRVLQEILVLLVTRVLQETMVREVLEVLLVLPECAPSSPAIAAAAAGCADG
jgi:hypothetical protein